MTRARIVMCVVWGVCAACSQSVTPDETPSRMDHGIRDAPDLPGTTPEQPDMSPPLPVQDASSDAAITTQDMAMQDMVIQDLPSQDMTPDLPGVDPGAMLDAPATREQITHPFGIDIQGRGSGNVGEATVSQNLVSVVIDGISFEGVVQERQAWPDFSLVLYQSLLVSEDDVRVAWFYCDGDRLTWIYHEGSRSPMRDESMQGTCTESETSTTTQIDLPAVSFEPPEPLQGFRVDGGDDIQIYEGRGQAQSFALLGGERYRLYPFEQVDCSRECGTPGWYEIHTLMERERDDALGFIIFYLRNPGQIEGYYSIVWPGFDKLAPLRTSATWSTP